PRRPRTPAARRPPRHRGAPAAPSAPVGALPARLSTELRSAVDGLRPADLARDGLAATLASQLALAGRAHDVPVEVHADELPELDPDVEHQVLRIAQEAVSNALRHARASRVTVAAGTGPDGGLVLTVTDDGRGFDPEAPP